jgi:AraC-like DNA-binding protein
MKEYITKEHILAHTELPIFGEYYEHDPSTYTYTVAHSHEFAEIGIVLSGHAMHKTDTGVKSLKKGSVFLIPIGSSHSFSEPHMMCIQNIYLLPKLLYHNLCGSLKSHIQIQQFLLRHSSPKNSLPIEFELSDNSISVICAFANAYKSIKFNNLHYKNDFGLNCFMNILMVICDEYSLSEHFVAKTSDSRICDIMEIINNNIEKPTKEILHELSSNLNIHPYQINHIIKQAFNMPISDLVIEYKIETSRTLLISEKSVSQIAFELGFYDHSHFNKYFVRYSGTTPTAYRNKYMKQNSGGRG